MERIKHGVALRELIRLFSMDNIKGAPVLMQGLNRRFDI
jgi:hypothetical protein